jgi:hypothetical protein
MGFLKALIHPEVRRTCRKCGSTWNVPRYDTKRHWTGGGAGVLGPRGKAVMVQATMPDGDATASAQTRADFGTCQRCGATMWQQKRLWRASSP